MRNKGFTMVELLTAIVILGVLSTFAIVGVTKFIERSKEEADKELKTTLKLSAKSFMEANTSQLPKEIGAKVDISAQELKDTNFLKGDLKNSKGENCIDNSFVRVVKLSKTKYKYESYFYCENDKYEETDDNKPVIELYFIDSKGTEMEEYKDVLDNIDTESVYIKMNGGISKEDNKKLALVGYTYIVSIVKNGIETEVYNSGTLSAGNYHEVIQKKKLTDYIDVTEATDFNVKVIAYNEKGEKTVAESQKVYSDTDGPICTDKQGEPEENEWLNKTDYEAGKTRTIKATCKDIGASGCLRNSFKKSWPNSTEKSTDYGIIEMEDNASNVGKCKVRVNVDIVLPTVEVTSKYLKEKKVADDKNEIIKIDEKDYKDLVNGWVNAKTYDEGLVFNVKMKDDMDLISYKWKTNGDSSENKTGKINAKTKTISIKLTKEGADREGVLTVKDKAGNTTTVKIKAKIDKTTPKCGDKTGGSTKWSNAASRKIGVKCSDSVSKCEEDIFYKNVKNEVKTKSETITIKDKAGNTKSCKNTYDIYLDRTLPICGNKIGGSTVWSNAASRKIGITCDDALSGCTDSTIYKNVTTETRTKNESIKISDKAGNVQDCKNTYNIYLDRTAPKCGSKIGESTTWSKATSRKVGIKCTDSLSNCTQETFYKEVTSQGATANVDIGIKDKAGNTNVCKNLYNIYIDRTPPTCGSKTGESTTWSNAASRTLGMKCSDAESGCERDVYTQNVSTQTATGSLTFTLKDKVGNSKICTKTYNIYLDRTPPSCNGKIGESTTWSKAASRTIGIKCTDALSRCTSPAFTKNVTDEVRTKTETITIRDKANNTTVCRGNFGIYLDRTPPTCGDAWGGSTVWSNAASRRVGVNCSDSLSECSRSSFYKDVTDEVRTKKVSITIQDHALNTTSCSGNYNIYLDRTPPKFISQSQRENHSIGSHEWLSTWQDPLSGLATIADGGVDGGVSKVYYCYGSCSRKCSKTKNEENSMTHLGKIGGVKDYYLKLARVADRIDPGNTGKDTIVMQTNYSCNNGKYTVKAEAHIEDRAGNVTKKYLEWTFKGIS